MCTSSGPYGHDYKHYLMHTRFCSSCKGSTTIDNTAYTDLIAIAEKERETDLPEIPKSRLRKIAERVLVVSHGSVVVLLDVYCFSYAV